LPWLQMIFEASTTQISLLEDRLPDLGAVAVTLEDNADQALYEPPLGTTPLWENTRIIGLFEADTDLNQVIKRLQPTFPEGLPLYRIEILEDKNWEQVWMERFQPLCFGQRLWICPSWCEAPQPDAINLLLDPGLAFGTGTHPTTALCLEWLDAADLHGKTLIDYGCGSGILAIAACLLGCNTVWAVDNDPQALTACAANAEKNKVSDRIHISSPDVFASEFSGKADIVMANILAGPLQTLAPTLMTYLKPDGQLILSGILESQGEQVKKAYQPTLIFAPNVQREEWLRLDARHVKQQV